MPHRPPQIRLRPRHPILLPPPRIPLPPLLLPPRRRPRLHPSARFRPARMPRLLPRPRRLPPAQAQVFQLPASSLSARMTSLRRHPQRLLPLRRTTRRLPPLPTSIHLNQLQLPLRPLSPQLLFRLRRRRLPPRYRLAPPIHPHPERQSSRRQMPLPILRSSRMTSNWSREPPCFPI